MNPPVTSIYPSNTQSFQTSEIGALSYYKIGTGEKVLFFVHGLGSYALSWQHNVKELSAANTCICVDLPGFGLSSLSPSGYSLKKIARGLGELMQHLQIQNVTYIGHSMGAQIGILLALQHRILVERLVMIAPAGFEEFTVWDKSMIQGGMGMMSWFSTPENYVRQMINSSFYTPSKQERMIQDLVQLMRRHKSYAYDAMVRQYMQSMLDEPVFNLLKNLEQPCLILFGMQDGLIPNRMLHHSSVKEVATAGAAQIARSKVYLIKGAGHYVHWEKAQLVNNFILGFLSK